jgi:hypothetical protein
MRPFPFLEIAVTAVGHRVLVVVSLGAILVQVAASTPHTTGWLSTVGPDVSELLAVVALC